jgi:hypothetical protein
MATIKVFDNQTTDGNSLEFTINGRGFIKASGDFGGGTLTLQARLANTDDSFTSTGSNDVINDIGLMKEISSIKGVEYRLNLSGATAASLTVFVEDNS